MAWPVVTQPPTLPPPNWYPDPAGMGELRYWNGWAWTPSVAIGGQVVERPLPSPAAPALPGRSGPAVERPSRREGMAELPLRAGLWGLAAFAIGVVAAIAVSIGGSALDLPGVVVLLLGQAALWAALVGACVMASRRFGTGHLARDFGLRFRPSDVSWGLLTSVVARVAGVIVLIPFVLVWPRLFEGNQNPYRDLEGDPAMVIAFAALALLGAPLVEELFFRGLLQGSLIGSIGTAGAIAVQAVLFGLVHFDPALGVSAIAIVAMITVAGVVFGIAAWWKRLGTSVMAHVFFNVLAVTLLLANELG